MLFFFCCCYLLFLDFFNIFSFLFFYLFIFICWSTVEPEPQELIVVSPIWFGDKSQLFVDDVTIASEVMVNTRFGFIGCANCGYALKHNTWTDHVLTHHRRKVTPQQRDQLNSIISQIACDLTKNTQPRSTPVQGLKLLTGFECLDCSTAGTPYFTISDPVKQRQHQHKHFQLCNFQRWTYNGPAFKVVVVFEFFFFFFFVGV